MFRKKATPNPTKVKELVKRFNKDFSTTPFKQNQLNSNFPINGTDYELIGMTPSGGFMMKKSTDESYWLVDSETITSGLNISTKLSAMADEKMEMIEIVPMKMKNIKFDPSIFVPMTTGTPLDKMFSSRGGIFPATNYIVVGDPGIGKSTLTLDILANIKKNHPELKVLFISGEMTQIDMYDYIQRYPKFGEIDTIFLGEYLDANPKQVIESVFNNGYDLVLADSFVEVQEAVKESCGMTSKSSEKWLIDLMVSNNLGNNKRSKYSSFLMIQQVTKGGNFVGSNKLKHNTTGMMEIRYSNEFSGDRYVKFTKNRRGCEHDKLYFSLDKADDVDYDLARLQRDIDIKDRLSNEKNTLLREEELFNTLFKETDKVGEEA